MKIFIAGGGGYVGCVLAEYMKKLDDVTIFDRFIYGVPEILGVRMIHGDIRRVTVAELEGSDVVINLAGFSNDPTAEFSPEANDELNTDAAVRLMKQARLAGVPRYVFASSASVYDKSPDAVMAHEDSDLVERDKMYPYSRAKINAEEQLEAFAMEYDQSLVILRKGTVHGPSPRMRFDLVVNAMAADAIRGKPVSVHVHPREAMYRPIVDVADVVTAYQRACVLKLADGQSEIFNICSDNLSVTEIGAQVASAFSSRVALVTIPADRNIRTYKMSNAKARSVLEWKPHTSLEAAAERLYDFLCTKENAMLIDHPRTSNIEWMKIIMAIEGSYRQYGSLI